LSKHGEEKEQIMSPHSSRRPSLRIGAAQFAAVTGDIAANLQAMQRLVEQAAKAKVRLVLFPELALSGYDLDCLQQDPLSLAVDLDGPEIQSMCAQCWQHNITVLMGLPLLREEKLTNSLLLIGPQGEILDRYDKFYLDGPENTFFKRGDKACTIQLDGWTLGLGICYDASFPEFSRNLALAGAELLLYAGAFVKGASSRRRDIYHPARALENGCYVAFANFVGQHAGMNFCGQSAIYGPDGESMILASEANEELIVAEIEYSHLVLQRDAIQMLQDCRIPPPNVQNQVVG
jgi:predicted amidohydrolase